MIYVNTADMESTFVEPPLGNTNSWQIIFRLTLLSCFLVIFLHLLRKWRKYVNLVNQLPMLKLRFYHFLGHLHAILYIRTLKTPVSIHVYDFLLMNGYSFLFQKQGIAAAWGFIFPIVHFHKAESVEVILNHSTQLEKAWPYKFTHPWLGRGLLTSNGSKWKNRRKLLTPAFHFNILKDFVPVFNKQSKILADILNEHTSDEFIDIVPFITKCSFDIICESVLGVQMHSQTNSSCSYLTSVNLLTSAIFERMVNPLYWLDFTFKMSPLGRKFFKNVKIVHDFTYKLIDERKKKRLLTSSIKKTTEEENLTRKRRALLDLLVEEHMNNNSMSETDIREEVDTFTFEGHDTTSMGMSWALYLIGLHPGVQEKIHQELDSIFGNSERDATVDDLKEMKYLECVLRESLRLYPPVPFFGRQLTEDIEFQGFKVPKGSTCMVFPYVSHRDPDVFPNPEKFDPERFTLENSAGRHPFAYIPFSAGPRNCIGQRFALMEEKIVISTILRKFKFRSLDPRDKVHVMNEIVLRPLGGLRIEIRHRSYIPEKSTFFYYP